MLHSVITFGEKLHNSPTLVFHKVMRGNKHFMTRYGENLDFQTKKNKILYF